MTGRQYTRILGGVRTSSFRSSERLVKCPLWRTQAQFFLFCFFFFGSFGSVTYVADGHLLARRRRRTKLPTVGQPTAQTVRSRSLGGCPSASEINTCKSQPRLIPLVLGRHLTPTRTISKPLMCMLWVVSSPAAPYLHFMIPEITRSHAAMVKVRISFMRTCARCTDYSACEQVDKRRDWSPL